MRCYWHVVDGNSPNICGVHCNWEFYSPYLHLPSTQRTLQTTTNLLSFRQKLMLKKYSFWQCPLSTQHCWHMQHWKHSSDVKILCKFWVFCLHLSWNLLMHFKFQSKYLSNQSMHPRLNWSGCPALNVFLFKVRNQCWIHILHLCLYSIIYSLRLW